MKAAIVFDCEFLTSEGAQSRFWCGPFDPDPVVVQLGAVKLGLTEPYEILETLQCLLLPKGRDGEPLQIDPFFLNLTGLDGYLIQRNGLSLQQALSQLDMFSEECHFWSWGKDELNLLAISCYISNIKPPIPATRFSNACSLFIKSGMPYEVLQKTRSNQLASYYSLPVQGLKPHDALDDAMSVALSLQHLLKTRKLLPHDFVKG